MITRICMALTLVASGWAYAGVPTIERRAPPGYSFWTQEWSDIEWDWMNELGVLLDYVSRDQTEQAIDQLKPMLGVLGRLNVLAQRPVRKDNPVQVEQALTRILVENSLYVRSLVETFDYSHGRALNVVMTLLLRQSDDPALVRAAMAPKFWPRMWDYIFGRAYWTAGGTGTGFAGAVSMLPEHTHPYTYLTVSVTALSALFGVTVAKITAPKFPRGQLPWDENYVSGVLEDCQRSLIKF